jgi:hypothetical protein
MMAFLFATIIRSDFMAQIRISDEQKEKLRNIKLHPRDTYEDTIKRVLGWWEYCEETCQSKDCILHKDMDDELKELIKNGLEKNFGVKCTKIVDAHDGTDFHMEGDPKGTPVWIPKR